MWVIYLEMGVALALLILIVWFTRPRKRNGAPPAHAVQKEPGKDDRG